MYLNKGRFCHSGKMLQIDKRLSKFCSISKVGVELMFQKHVKKAPDAAIGKIARERLTKMGPTFIKIGQFISTRSDIFGNEFTNELKILQDKIEPFEFNPESINLPDIEYINPKPVATASIGQVYKGKHKNGREVAIKVKRPGIDQTIDTDFQAFLFLLDVLNIVSNKREATEFTILFNEYYRLLKEEIDFKKEVDNMVRFKAMFKSKSYVKVPTPYVDICTNDIIVMEYVPAYRIDDMPKMTSLRFSKQKIAQKLVELFLDQILDHGVIHIDPHPGNVGISDKGKIVFYDYGMVQKVDIDFKKNLKDILLALYDKNIDYICQLLIDNKIVIIEQEKIPYLKNFVLSLINYVDNLDIDDFKMTFIDRIDTSEMPFVTSSKFLLILRGLSIIEGICKKLDPTFNYREVIEKYIDESVIDFQYLEKKAMMDIDNMRTMPDKVTQNEINIEIVQKSMQRMEGKFQPQNMKLLVAMSCMFAFDIVDNFVIKGVITAMTTYVILYK